MGYAGTTVRAAITTLMYAFPPRNGAWNDVPQEINEAVNLFDNNNDNKVKDSLILVILVITTYVYQVLYSLHYFTHQC